MSKKIVFLCILLFWINGQYGLSLGWWRPQAESWETGKSSLYSCHKILLEIMFSLFGGHYSWVLQWMWLSNIWLDLGYAIRLWASICMNFREWILRDAQKTGFLRIMLPSHTSSPEIVSKKCLFKYPISYQGPIGTGQEILHLNPP